MPIVLIEWPEILGPTSEIALEEYLLAMVVSLAASVATYALYLIFYRDWQRGAGIHRVFLLAGPAITLLFIAIQWSLPLVAGTAGSTLICPLPHADQRSSGNRIPVGRHCVVDRRSDIQLRTDRNPVRRRRASARRTAHLLRYRVRRSRRRQPRPDHHHVVNGLYRARGRAVAVPERKSEGVQDGVNDPKRRSRESARHVQKLAPR